VSTSSLTLDQQHAPAFAKASLPALRLAIYNADGSHPHGCAIRLASRRLRDFHAPRLGPIDSYEQIPMSLVIGTRLGAYEVTSSLGAGGMGEVFRARDTKLNRDVALKILPEAFAADPERLARFTREAQTLAALNHTHIAHIYGLERLEGAPAFIVMELVEGEDLAARITRGTLPLDEALPIARQIAEALEAAHDKGIVHRDLKPANVMLTADGQVKVLDFGLAKALEGGAVSTVGAPYTASLSPTLTTPAMTAAGMILGTAAYMSPEQAKGRAVDKRSDVWAFGCVLYEMITSRRAFEGEDVSDTLATILKGEPAWDALPATVPPHVRALVEGCLKKDRQLRIGDISTALFLLHQPALTFGAQQASVAIAPAQPLWKRALPLAATAVVAAAITGAVAWSIRPPAPQPTITRFSIGLPEGQVFANTGRQVLAISRDGSRIVYRATGGLYLRSLADLEARPIPGTDSVTVTNPVFSPDGQSIAFHQANALKRIAAIGGAAVTICPADNPFGMTWDHDEILFGQVNKGIMRVSANGGKADVVVGVKGDERMHGPQLLPGGEAILFTLAAGLGPDMWETSQIVVQSLKSGERKTLVSGGTDARYLPTGHIVYAFGGVVFAVRFDAKRLALVGGPVPVIEGVSRAINSTGTAQFSVADNGTLVFVPGPAVTSASQQDVAFRDRQGTVQPLKLPPAPYEHPRVSPDGTRLAVGTDDGKDAIVWIYDLSGASSRRQLTFGGRNGYPIWSADGQRVTFSSNREGDFSLFWQRADGAGTAERLTKAEAGTAHIPQSWAPDGRTLVFTAIKGAKASLWTLSMANKQAAPYAGIEADGPISAAFSPDGRWVAYGNIGIFVEPFPATGAKYRVSGNIHPFWSPDGTELFAFPRSRFASVTITTKPSFAFSTPVESPTGGFLVRGPSAERNVDIMPDGQRFVGIVSADQGPSGTLGGPRIQVVEHWFEDLKARVPLAR
jgi:serine/threonine protein kinase